MMWVALAPDLMKLNVDGVLSKSAVCGTISVFFCDNARVYKDV
jgi:hypothetical protein